MPPEAFVTECSDYSIRLTLEELIDWRKKSILKGELLEEGEKPSGKNFQITISSKIIGLMEFHPSSKSWEDKVIKFVCSETAFNRLEECGQLTTRIFHSDMYIRIPDHPKAEVWW